MEVTLATAAKPDVIVRLKHEEAMLLLDFLGELSRDSIKRILKTKPDDTCQFAFDFINP